MPGGACDLRILSRAILSAGRPGRRGHRTHQARGDAANAESLPETKTARNVRRDVSASVTPATALN